MKNSGIKTEKREFQVRTDLALEQRECVPGDGGEIAGVSLREWTGEQSLVKLSEVRILDGRGAEAMGKPQGTYLTLEAPQPGKGGRRMSGGGFQGAGYTDTAAVGFTFETSPDRQEGE